MIFERKNINTSMEAVTFRGSLDRPVSTCKSPNRNPKINYNQFFVHEHLMHASNFQNMGLLRTPPPLVSHSFPPYSIQQPPLLPLPTANPCHNAAGRALSCPSASKKAHNNNRARDPSLNPKRSKYPKTSPKKEGKLSPKKSSESILISSTGPSGQDPKDSQIDVTKVVPLISSTGSSDIEKLVAEDGMDVFSGSAVFAISPPPSSLPLPTFSLRPKLSCNVEAAAAAGIDTGATNNLRRLLRLL